MCHIWKKKQVFLIVFYISREMYAWNPRRSRESKAVTWVHGWGSSKERHSRGCPGIPRNPRKEHGTTSFRNSLKRWKGQNQHELLDYWEMSEYVNCESLVTFKWRLSPLKVVLLVVNTPWHKRCVLPSPLFAVVRPFHRAVVTAGGSVQQVGGDGAVSWVPLAVDQPRTPDTWAEKFESFERINSIRETNGKFDSCNSCKRLGTSRLHELHESKFPFVSRIEFIRSKLSNFLLMYSGSLSLLTHQGTPEAAFGFSRLVTLTPKPASMPT